MAVRSSIASPEANGSPLHVAESPWPSSGPWVSQSFLRRRLLIDGDTYRRSIRLLCALISMRPWRVRRSDDARSDSWGARHVHGHPALANARRHAATSRAGDHRSHLGRIVGWAARRANG